MNDSAEPAHQLGPHLGIVGGGQLGCMLHAAALKLGLPVRISDENPEAPGRQLAGGVPAESWADVVSSVGAQARVVTWEREDLDPHLFDALAAPVAPAQAILASLGDRIGHKQALDACGIATAAWAAADGSAEVDAVLAAVHLPAMVKARRGGFDGRGQVLVRTPQALADALDQYGRDGAGVGAIVEELVDFADEFAVLLTRGQDGAVVHYPITRTFQRDGQLAWAAAPHPLTDQLESWARPMIEALAAHLDYVGTLAVECFRCQDRLLVNEIAPRVHNSGHWTIEGCSISQFENHVRAVCGLPLCPAEACGVSLMANCIGDMPEFTDEDDAVVTGEEAGWSPRDGVFVHDYHKAARPQRKVGHVTVVADDAAALRAAAACLPNMLQPPAELMAEG